MGQLIIIVALVGYGIEVTMPEYIQVAKFGHEREVEDEFNVGLKYGVEPQLLKAVAQVESGLDHTAVNPYTNDYGILQINYKTAAAYNINIERLISDRAYSLDRGAFVLSEFQKQFAAKEPDTWVCRFNVGWGRLEGKRLYNCQIYLHKVKVAYGPLEI